MKAPAFWFAPRLSAAAAALLPFSLLWRLGASIRRKTTSVTRLEIPVICVGNANLGGTGKTPVAIDLANAMTEQGMQPHILTRGYGGTEAGPHRVDATTDTADRVGDEPLLLARAAPTWVSRDRVAGAQAAQLAGASHIIMDDGFQNPHLQKDIHILVVDQGIGFGNGQVFPAGPLREVADTAIARADVIILLGSGPAPDLPPEKPVLHGRFEGYLPDNLSARDRCLAFAGIGRPEKFFETAKELGLTLANVRAFSDHHRYDARELRNLQQEAEALSAHMITTEKDAVRLPGSFRDTVTAIPVALSWDEGGALIDSVLGFLPS